VCKLLHKKVVPVVRESAGQIPQPGSKIAGASPIVEVNCWRAAQATYLMGVWLRSTIASRIALGVLALAIAWVGFQLGTHGHTGILRILTKGKHFLSDSLASTDVQERNAKAPPGPQHSVNLSWKPSTSAVVGYNVYRRGTSGVVKVNSVPVTGTSFVDKTVQPGQTYFYLTKAVNAKGTESTSSNEVRADIPSP
jgi:hypothetical protein